MEAVRCMLSPLESGQAIHPPRPGTSTLLQQLEQRFTVFQNKSLRRYAADFLELVLLLPLTFQLFHFESNAKPRRIVCLVKHYYIPSEWFLFLNIS